MSFLKPVGFYIILIDPDEDGILDLYRTSYRPPYIKT